MKKILFFFAILSCTVAFSQCYIEGKSTLVKTKYIRLKTIPRSALNVTRGLLQAMK